MTQIRFLSIVAAAVLASVSCARAETLLVSNRGDNTVRVFDTETRAQVAEIDAGVGAHEFGVSSDGKTVVGSCYGSGHHHKTPDQRLFVLDVERLGPPRMIDLGDNPRPNDMRFLPGDLVMVVTSEVRQRVLEIDVATGRIVRELPYGEPAGHMLASSPDGTRVYVPCVGSGKVMVVDRLKGEVAGSVETAHGAEGVDISPDGTRVWVACNRSNSIAIIDTARVEVVQTIEADGFPFRVRFAENGNSVVVSHPMSNEVRVYNAADGAQRGRVALEGGQPTSIAISGDGSRAFVVCGGTSKIAEIDLATLEVVHWYETGPEPDAIAVSKAKAALS